MISPIWRLRKRSYDPAPRVETVSIPVMKPVLKNPSCLLFWLIDKTAASHNVWAGQILGYMHYPTFPEAIRTHAKACAEHLRHGIPPANKPCMFGLFKAYSISVSVFNDCKPTADEDLPILLGVLAEFFWMRVSLPVYTARPRMWPVFFRVQPRSSISFMVTGTALACAWPAMHKQGLSGHRWSI